MIQKTSLGTWRVALLSRAVFAKAFALSFPTSCTGALLHYRLHRASCDEIQALICLVWVASSILLGFLIVYQMQQVYSKWWAMLTLLQQVRGNWFSAFSNVVAFCSRDIELKDNVDNFQHLLIRLVSMLYYSAMQRVAAKDIGSFEVIDSYGIEAASLNFLETSPNQCEVILQWVQHHVVDSFHKGLLSIPASILSRVFEDFAHGLANLNDAEMLFGFPVPFPYSSVTFFLMSLYTFGTPIVCAVTLPRAWTVGLSSLVVLVVFWSLSIASTEIPFTSDFEDSPMREMQRSFNDSLSVLLETRAQTPPTFHFNQGRHLICRHTPKSFDETWTSCSTKIKDRLAEGSFRQHLQMSKDANGKQLTMPNIQLADTFYDVSNLLVDPWGNHPNHSWREMSRTEKHPSSRGSEAASVSGSVGSTHAAGSTFRRDDLCPGGGSTQAAVFAGRRDDLCLGGHCTGIAKPTAAEIAHGMSTTLEANEQGESASANYDTAIQVSDQRCKKEEETCEGAREKVFCNVQAHEERDEKLLERQPHDMCTLNSPAVQNRTKLSLETQVGLPNGCQSVGIKNSGQPPAVLKDGRKNRNKFGASGTKTLGPSQAASENRAESLPDVHGMISNSFHVLV